MQDEINIAFHHASKVTEKRWMSDVCNENVKQFTMVPWPSTYGPIHDRCLELAITLIFNNIVQRLGDLCDGRQKLRVSSKTQHIQVRFSSTWDQS